MKNDDKLILGGGSFEMPIQQSWQLTYFENDSSKAEVRFNNNKYPILGIKVNSYDDAQIHLNDNFKKYLLEEPLIKENTNLNIKKDAAGIYSLEYEANLDTGENARVYRKAKIIGARTIRVATLAFSWMQTKEADELVKVIVKQIAKSIDKVYFPDKKSLLDEEANIVNRLKKIRFKNIVLWDNFSFDIPSSWKYEINLDDKNLEARVVGYEDAMLFIEGGSFLLPDGFLNASDYIKNLSASLKSKNLLQNVILQSGEKNTYLVSCNRKQLDQAVNINLQHYFWHYFVYNNKFFKKLSFTFVFPEKQDRFLYHLPSILDNAIKSIKIKKNNINL